MKKGRVRIRVMEEAGSKHIRSKSYRQDVDFETACRMVASLSKKGGPARGKSKEIPKIQAYCVKCRKNVEIKNAQNVVLKNKRPATRGVCPTCGTKIFRMGTK